MKKLFPLLGVTLVVLAGCAQPQDAEPVDRSGWVRTATPTATATATPSPTPTPTQTSAPAPTPTPEPPAPPPPALVQSAGVEGWRVLVSAYFPPGSVETVLRIMRCESGGNASAHNQNPNTKDDSVGLMQINLHEQLLPGRIALLQRLGYAVHDRETAVAALLQPEINLHMASAISGGVSFGPWSCY